MKRMSKAIEIIFILLLVRIYMSRSRIIHIPKHIIVQIHINKFIQFHLLSTIWMQNTNLHSIIINKSNKDNLILTMLISSHRIRKHIISTIKTNIHTRRQSIDLNQMFLAINHKDNGIILITVDLLLICIRNLWIRLLEINRTTDKRHCRTNKPWKSIVKEVETY